MKGQKKNCPVETRLKIKKFFCFCDFFRRQFKEKKNSCHIQKHQLPTSSGPVTEISKTKTFLNGQVAPVETRSKIAIFLCFFLFFSAALKKKKDSCQIQKANFQGVQTRCQKSRHRECEGAEGFARSENPQKNRPTRNPVKNRNFFFF